jgi:hypothetical protein
MREESTFSMRMPFSAAIWAHFSRILRLLMPSMLGSLGREPVADVGFAKGTENGVGDGVAEHIGIGMALQTTAVRDGDSAEHERAAFEGVDVVTKG